MTFTGPQIAEPLQRRAPDFNAMTGATINIVTVPFSNLYSKVLTDWAAGTNSIDAAVFAPQWAVDYVVPGFLENLSERVAGDAALQEDDIAPFFREFSQKYAGDTYMLTLDGDFQMVYYRSDLFADAGIAAPETWQDYIAAAEALHGKDMNGDGSPDYGSCISKKRSAQAYWMILSVAGGFLRSQGTSQGIFFNADTMEPLLNNDAFSAALDVYVETTAYGPPDEINLDVGDTRSLFTSGRCALTIDWGDIGTLAIVPAARDRGDRIAEWVDRNAGKLFILPAVLTLLAFALFPLLVSAHLSLTKLKLAAGGFLLKYVGWLNFKKLFFGSQQYHLLGTFDRFGAVDWLILGAIFALLLFFFVRYLVRPGRTVLGVFGRSVALLVAGALALLLVATLGGGFPGSLVVTIFYVAVGVSVQFGLALGLTVLFSQKIYGRNLFRVVFFLPVMVTPVGIAYMFRMLADMHKGPFADIWSWLGLGEFAWASDPWTARMVVLIGDTWRWTPFMFIVLLAAIENQPRDQLEAARIDGAGGWQIFRDITWPAIAPVAATIVLIRLIEAFKIIDLPNVLTNGGPGIATESLTLHAFIAWRTQDLGGSAAVGYTLLFVATVACLSFFNFAGRRTRRAEA